MNKFVGSRSIKRLDCVAAASRHQREWFADLRQRVAAGEQLALVDAGTPHEILRALDIPYVVIQWWSALCAAKQLGPRYLARLGERGYPDDSQQYSAIPLGSALDDESDSAPWGGLPKVSFVMGRLHSAAQRGLGEAWRRELGVAYFPLEVAVPVTVPECWWDRVARGWEDVVGARRLDLMTAEFRAMIGRLEQLTGRTFDEAKFSQIMDLANEQAEWNRRARDLLARTVPAPIDIADTIPAVMLPQWHRGSVWARDAAHRFHDEVADLVARGDALCPDERVRLMWIGRGLWFNPGFYQHFQEAYGAVFVWSMYHGIAADGYARYGPDPVRSLAAKFAPFADFLGAPGWANAWYVNEARRHLVDGVVNLVAREARGNYFVRSSFEAAGIPVFEIDANNADAREWDEGALADEISQFIERDVEPVAAKRRGGRE